MMGELESVWQGGARSARPVALVSERQAIASAAEAAAMLAYMVYYIWALEPAGHGLHWPYFALFFLITLLSHRLHGDTLADLGIRADTLPRALAEGLAVIAPALLLAFVIGRFMDGGRPMTPGRAGLSLLGIYPWALFQQYGLQCFFGRRLGEVLRHPIGHDVVCAGIFAALHLPNPFLTVVTFGAGYCFCALFRRCPNLFAVAGLHALASTVLYYCLPPAVTFLMRVGPGYLLNLRLGG